MYDTVCLDSHASLACAPATFQQKQSCVLGTLDIDGCVAGFDAPKVLPKEKNCPDTLDTVEVPSQPRSPPSSAEKTISFLEKENKKIAVDSVVFQRDHNCVDG